MKSIIGNVRSGKVVSYFLVAIFTFAAAQFAQAAGTWKADKVGGSEESPYNIWDTANWDGSLGSGTLNLAVSEKTYFKSESTSQIAGDFDVNSGDFVFLGPLNFLCYKSDTANARSSVLKKGDWTVKNYGLHIGSGAGTTVAFTNETGNANMTGSRDNDSILSVAAGEGATVEVVKESGNWSVSKTAFIGDGKNSIARFYNRGGFLTAAKYGVCIGDGNGGTTGSAYLEISGGAVTNTAGNLSIGDGNSGGTAEVRVNGGEYCAQAGYVFVGSKGRGTLTIDSGRVIASASGVRFCDNALCGSGRDCFLNLNGGTLEATTVTYGSGSANATFTFNGGTLKALNDNTTLIEDKAKLSVVVNGGTIDTDGKKVTIAKELTGTGGLTFVGGGMITLSGAVNYSGKTAVTPGTTLAVANETAKDNILANGLVLAGLPTADQTIMTYTSDLTGADLSEVKCPLAPATTFKIGSDNMSIVVDVPGAALDNYWTGAANDGDLSNGANWSNGNVPTSGNANIFCTTNSTLTKGATFAPTSITFLPGASTTISGSGLTVSVISNLSTVVHTFACPLTFADTYSVHCDCAPVNFAGGATATYPDPGMTDNAASHTLMGEITFTNDWSQGKVAYPYTVPNGAILHGEDARGTDATATSGTNAKGDFLSIEDGGKAYFKTVFVDKNNSHINTDGELHVEDVLEVGGSSQCHATHDQNDTGVIYADGLHKNVKNDVYIKVPTLYIGSKGLGSKVKDYTIHFADAAKTVYATDDFEIFSPTNSNNRQDWGLNLEKQVTFNTQGHIINWTGGARGSGALVKDGEGTLIFNPPGTTLSGAVTVKGGTLKVMSASGVSTGAMTVKDGGTLDVASDATLGSSAVTLEVRSTLALTATNNTFTALANAVTLPTGANEKAVIRLDGQRLKAGNHTILSNVAAGATDNVALDMTGSALVGRKKASLAVEGTDLVLTIEPNAMIILIR